MDNLPEACIAHILSFTSLPDACRLSCVSSSFLSAAVSDALWNSFIPSDCLSLLSPPPSFPSKKHLFLSLSQQPRLIDNGLKSFWLDKFSGAKCFMLSSRSLFIVWGETPVYWTWLSVPESRFTEVAELRDVCWLEIRGRINTRLLSSSTLYAAYLVFKLTAHTKGLKNKPTDVSIGTAGNKNWRVVYLVPRKAQSRAIPVENLNRQYPNKRADGWLEIELGDFFNEGIDDQELEMAVCELNGHWKRGLVIEGLEIRPKLT
ncbi:F-box protein At2g02240-like [Neltuma alba]|uniref:F-box protein At2g02240-like n=1 Tax=Neltuma alba TaxID=207710 RepID=UPI0010A3AC7B|nr:F-box protein At2g02240-like [Prosopis alba]